MQSFVRSAVVRSAVVRAAVVLVSCLVALPAGAQPGDKVVAEVGGRAITTRDLTAYMEGRLYQYLFPDRAESYQRALEDLVTDERKRLDFFASGLARDDAFVRSIQRTLAEELVATYARSQYEDRYLNEAALRAEHEAMGRVVLYRQIILYKPPGASPAALDSLRATVDAIQRQLDEGVPFDTLARRYSQAGPGGAVARATWQQTVHNPHAYLVFRLSPGEARSFEGPSSFSVTRVEGVEQAPLPPFDDVRDEIVRALHGWHAAGATRAFQNEWNALVDTTALRWHPAALEQVVAWSNTPGFFEGDYRTTVAQYLAGHDDAPVLSDGHGTLRISDLPRLFDEVLTLEASGGHDAAFIQEFILEAVRTERLGARARALGLDDRLLRPDTPSPVLAAAFVQYYNQQRIESQIPEPTEAALRDFYEAHRDSLFYQLARVDTEIIVRADEDEIEALWDRVQQGASFAEVSHRRLLRSFERTRDGEIVTRFNREPPYLGAVAFGLKEGEVAGPVAYDDAVEGRRYAIVRATRRLEERQLGFDEVRDRVAEAFVDHHRARIAADVAADLRDRYPATIHRDVLERALTASR